MSNYDVIIVGGGPGGCSAAARLAESGVRVLLLEEKRMPREKLCGEFITPESFPTLRRLGVMDRMLAAGAQKITRLSLAAASGKTVNTPIAEMSDEAGWAMSLSRAKFDQVLFERASEVGVDCLEGIAVKQCLRGGNTLRGVEAMSLPDGKIVTFEAPLIIDASGRNSRLTVKRNERVAGRRGARLYAMKAHLKGVAGIEEQVELYFFPQGYGGLSRVEENLVNLCFIVNESTMKSAGGDAYSVMKQTVMRNNLAGERLLKAEVVGKWLSVGPLAFGKRRLSRNGVIAVGDASGMIDPFTGTGIQIALRTGEIAAESIIESLGSASLSSEIGFNQSAASQVSQGLLGHAAADHRGGAFNSGSSGAELLRRVLASYQSRYEQEFGTRMRVAGLLRGAAFSPGAANFLAGILARTPRLARTVLRATRSGRSHGAAIGQP